MVDAGLEALAAHLAVQLADAELLVEFYGDGLFVIAEEAGEGYGEGVALRGSGGLVLVVWTRGEGEE